MAASDPICGGVERGILNTQRLALRKKKGSPGIARRWVWKKNEKRVAGDSVTLGVEKKSVSKKNLPCFASKKHSGMQDCRFWKKNLFSNRSTCGSYNLVTDHVIFSKN